MSDTSFSGVTHDWESLLAACEKNAELLGAFEQHGTALIALLHHTRALKKRQELLEAARQASTKQLGEAIAQGKEEARRLRRLVGARLGTDNEILADFGVAPIRKRKTRSPETA